MNALEKAARAALKLVEAVQAGDSAGKESMRTYIARVDATNVDALGDDLRAALEAEAGWELVNEYAEQRASQPYEARVFRRPLVDYSRDHALHPHEGDGDICSRCGEHRSWHDE